VPAPALQIRRLTPADASAYQELRLAGLQNAPSAFGSSYEEEKDNPIATIEGRLAFKADSGSFGAFESNILLGHVALARERANKLAHKAFIWGMYVTPTARGKGIARALVVEVLSFARSVSDIRQVSLSVNASNQSAIHLYESAGFKAYGREPGALLINGELHDEIHMYLRLTEG
jgi:ribosomal protein S18 acetylase RimI-like enzyme